MNPSKPSVTVWHRDPPETAEQIIYRQGWEIIRLESSVTAWRTAFWVLLALSVAIHYGFFDWLNG